MLIVICSIYINTTIILIVVSLLGVIYSLLIAKENKYGLLIGIVYYLLYGLVMYFEKMYALFFYNIIYSIPMMIYGFYNWNQKIENKNSHIKALNFNDKIKIIIITTILILIYISVLNLFNSNNIVLDSIISILGYLGVYLMSNKYYEQWIVWIISNVLCIYLYSTMFLNDSNNLPILIMWIIYLINSVYGNITWNKKVRYNQNYDIIKEI